MFIPVYIRANLTNLLFFYCVESCEKSLCNSMTTENVCSLLILARDRVSQELKKRAVDFISQNIEAVTSSEGWQELVLEPHLMTDVVRSMGPKIKSEM